MGFPHTELGAPVMQINGHVDMMFKLRAARCCYIGLKQIVELRLPLVVLHVLSSTLKKKKNIIIAVIEVNLNEHGHCLRSSLKLWYPAIGRLSCICAGLRAVISNLSQIKIQGSKKLRINPCFDKDMHTWSNVLNFLLITDTKVKRRCRIATFVHKRWDDV